MHPFIAELVRYIAAEKKKKTSLLPPSHGRFHFKYNIERFNFTLGIKLTVNIKQKQMKDHCKKCLNQV